MASAGYRVLTPERVSLEYDIAGLGSRGAAALIDTGIQTLALVVILVALGAGFAASSAFLASAGGPGAATLIVALFGVAVLLIADGYFILFEILWNGQTPGKRLLGIRVIRENGYPMRPLDAVIRNLVRMVDWLPLGYGVGVMAMLLNTRAKRLGDFAGGTIVVREGRAGVASVWLPGPKAESSSVRLSSSDATLVRDFLVRRSTMDPQARAELAARLKAALIQRYRLTTDAAREPEAFLEQL